MSRLADMLDSFTRTGVGATVGAGNPNLNRERRVRYQHPKGAPDADLIFGSKSVFYMNRKLLL